MKTLAIVPKNVNKFFSIENVCEIKIEGTSVYLAPVEVERPNFVGHSPSNSRKILVKVEAFSCNYRDKALIVKNALKRKKFPVSNVPPFAFFGSDFIASVVEIGQGVKTLKVGDRVIPDCSYPTAKDNSAPPGVVTNEASKGWLILDESKLMKISDSMPNEVAAGFSIGGQTASSLVRRTINSKNDRVLVTSGRSNTSQFVSWFLRQNGIKCDLVSTSQWSVEEVKFVKPCNVLRVERGAAWANSLPSDTYDVIIDPFFDLHIDASVNLLRTGGRYITCGFKNQHQSFKDSIDSTFNLDLHSIMLKAMVKNLSLLGNCIGYSHDLASAISLFESSNKLPMPIDGVYNLSLSKEFLEATYNSENRLGKAVMNYKL